MEFTEFKIKAKDKYVFNNIFLEILDEDNIKCNNININPVGNDFYIYEIPTEYANKITDKQISLIAEFLI